MTQHAAEVGCCDSSAGAFAPCLADCLHVPIWMCQNARAFALIGPMPSIRCQLPPVTDLCADNPDAVQDSIFHVVPCSGVCVVSLLLRAVED